MVGGKSPGDRWRRRAETLITLGRDHFGVERGHLEVTPVDMGSLPRPAERAVDDGKSDEGSRNPPVASSKTRSEPEGMWTYREGTVGSPIRKGGEVTLLSLRLMLH